MSMWHKASNGDAVKPLAVSIDPSGVVVTKNHVLVPATDEFPAHWEYDEAQMSLEQYEAYAFQDSMNELNRADIDYLLMITED